MRRNVLRTIECALAPFTALARFTMREARQAMVETRHRHLLEDWPLGTHVYLAGEPGVWRIAGVHGVEIYLTHIEGGIRRHVTLPEGERIPFFPTLTARPDQLTRVEDAS